MPSKAFVAACAAEGIGLLSVGIPRTDGATNVPPLLSYSVATRGMRSVPVSCPGDSAPPGLAVSGSFITGLSPGGGVLIGVSTPSDIIRLLG